MLVLLLLLPLLHALPIVVVPPPLLVSTPHLEDVLGYLWHMLVHGSVYGYHGATPTDCSAQPGDYS
jgi:hypothetical protein